MNSPRTLEELTEIFRSLGSSYPELSARSEIEEGIPQLARFIFLQQAWSGIAREGDSGWIDEEIRSAKANPDRPYAGLGHALERCLSKGVSADDITEITRCLQAQMLFNIGYLIDGPRFTPEPLEEIGWGLFQTDSNDQPYGKQIGALYESVLEFDPTGREMRPKK